MANSARREATYEDLLQVPDTMVAQIIDGELIVSPRPALLHAGVEGDLFTELAGPFQRGRGGPGGWWLCVEPEVHLGKDIVVPDLAGWRRARLPEWPDAPYLTLSPDWVCEILSPSTARLDRGKKLDLYAREGVGHAWLLDPQACTVEVFALEAGRWVRLASHAAPDAVRAAPFEAVPLELAAVFRRPPGAPLKVSEAEPAVL